MSKNIVFILLVVGSVLLLFYLGRLLIQYDSLRKELASLEREAMIFQERNLQLSQTIKALQSPEVLEKEARARLNYQKEGEKVVVIIPPKEEATSGPKKIEAEGLFANLIKWYYYIFK